MSKFFYIEKQSYLLIWFITVNYSVICFAKRSYHYFQKYEDLYNDFAKGWPIISNKRDKSDFEWENIIYILQNLYPYALLYMLVSEILRQKCVCKKVYCLWQISFTLIYLQYSLGWICTLMMISQPLFFLCARYLSKTTECTWLCCIISLTAITIYKKHEEVVHFLNLDSNELYILSVSLCWMTLKCCSFYLERPLSKSALDFFSYCFYLPTVFTGPFILHEDFKYVYESPQFTLNTRLLKFIKNNLRCIFWFCFGHICLHFVYVGATIYQPKLVSEFDYWSLCGFGYTMGQFFHIKYLVLYGLSTSLASFENIKVPFLPRCIGRIHLYSDMWKYFDQGLYKFLIKHIYIPLLRIIGSKTLTSLICFSFVWFWHGTEEYIMYWSLLNFLGIVIENVSKSLQKKQLTNYTRRISPNSLRRIQCLLAAPLLAVSAISNFYFFGGKEVGNIFFQRLFSGGTIEEIFLILILYCCCQVSTEFRTIHANKM